MNDGSGIVPVALGYLGAEEVSGVLFGSAGIFPELFVDASASGRYRWKVAYLNDSDRVVGAPNVVDVTMP